MKKIIGIVLAVVLVFGAGSVVMDLAHKDESRYYSITYLEEDGSMTDYIIESNRDQLKTYKRV